MSKERTKPSIKEMDIQTLNAFLNVYEVYKDLVALYLEDIKLPPDNLEVIYIRELVPIIRGLAEELQIDPSGKGSFKMPDDYIPFENLNSVGAVLRAKNQTTDIARERIYEIYGDLKVFANQSGAVGQEMPDGIQPLINRTRELIFEERARRTPDDTIPKIRLRDFNIIFDEDHSIIQVGSIRCQLPPLKKEHYFARIMWEYRVGESVSWDVVTREIKEVAGARDLKEKSVMDTMYRVNDRIKEIVRTDDELFSRKNQNIIRNFGE